MRTLALRSTCILAIIVGLAASAGSSAVVAAQSAAAPKNLRVTGVTDWTVSLAWDAAKGKAPASYVVQCSNGRTMSVPGTQTTAVFSNGFDYNRTYSFRVYAVSASGGWSGASNSVTARLLNDTTAAATPVVEATDVGPTHVDLSWSYSDIDPNPRFDIFVNGQLWLGQVAGRAKRIVFLNASTLYSFTVRARDSAGNLSALSDPEVVTTPAPDPEDDEAPTTPPGLSGGVIDGANEAMVTFDSSTDNVTEDEHIRYFVYVNGVFDGATVYPYPRRFSMYLTFGAENTIAVFAVDEAGNVSEPATMTVFVP